MPQERSPRLNVNIIRHNRVKMLITLVAFSCSIVQSEQYVFAMTVPQPKDRWTVLETRGSEAIDANQYWIAEPALLQALDIAEKSGPVDLRLANSLGELGRLYTIRGNYSKAEPYLEEELRIKEQLFEGSMGDLVPAMGTLISFYLTEDAASKADPLAEQLLALVEERLRDPGSLLKTTVKLKKGAPLQGWAGTAAPVAYDKLVECAVTLDSLGDEYRQRKNFDLADKLYKAALDLKSTVFGKQHLSLGNSYDRLGSLCLVKNDTAEAESYLKDSLAITEKIQPSDSPEVYGRLDHLAKCLIKEDKYQQAEDLYIRAQSFWKDEPCNNGNDARASYALGSLYADEKKYEAAAPLLQHALQLAEQYNGPASIDLVPYLQRYAYVLYYLGQKPESDQLKLRADNISGASNIAADTDQPQTK